MVENTGTSENLKIDGRRGRFMVLMMGLLGSLFLLLTAHLCSTGLCAATLPLNRL